jgi:hypothetical protein
MSKTLTGHTLAWRLSTVFVNLSWDVEEEKLYEPAENLSEAS